MRRPRYGRCSWLGSEPSTLESDIYVRHYALLVVVARNDDDDVDLVLLVVMTDMPQTGA